MPQTVIARVSCLTAGHAGSATSGVCVCVGIVITLLYHAFVVLFLFFYEAAGQFVSARSCQKPGV